MKSIPLIILISIFNWNPQTEPISFSLHTDITATVFWVGETGNVSSSWDGNWTQHFGGTDDPKKRNEFYPEGFTPKENPFYFALPYNDVPKSCDKVSEDVKELFTDPSTGGKAFFKNRWVKIISNNKTCYAQWEDCGPFLTCDPTYVFGTAKPKNTGNQNAGIDVSPAVRDYLGFSGMTKVSWQFVNQTDVPEGPWKKIVTTSAASW